MNNYENSNNQLTSFIIVAVLVYYVKAYKEFAGPTSVSLCLRETQLLSKKCRSGGESLTTLCQVSLALHLKLTPPAPEMIALPLDQLVVLLKLQFTVYMNSGVTCICSYGIANLTVY